MKVILADLRTAKGLVAKDTVAGGFGSRFVPFSKVTRVYSYFKSRLGEIPSLQLGYAAAIFSQHGHSIHYTRDALPEGDLALVLSSLVDYRREVSWAEQARRQGVRVGFLGLAATKLPELFEPHADFLILGEPESALLRLARGELLRGRILSPAVQNLDELPFPAWQVMNAADQACGVEPIRRFPVLSSRSCPEFCTYCPHRILSGYRTRSAANVADELEELAGRYGTPHVVFRDPLFTHDRARCLALCEALLQRGVRVAFDCETRLDALDEELLNALHRAGLQTLTFGVESVEAQTLRRVGRRPIPQPHQRWVIQACRKLGIRTLAYYVFGFLQDDWDSIAATIDYSIALGSTLAQYKILTPYPGTPLWKQLSPLIYETDWEKFDGYTPTFRHPRLSSEELRFLLGAAYARFYVRPGWLVNYWNLDGRLWRSLIRRMDQKALQWHARKEMALVSRAVQC